MITLSESLFFPHNTNNVKLVIKLCCDLTPQISVVCFTKYLLSPQMLENVDCSFSLSLISTSIKSLLWVLQVVLGTSGHGFYLHILISWDSSVMAKGWTCNILVFLFLYICQQFCHFIFFSIKPHHNKVWKICQASNFQSIPFRFFYCSRSNWIVFHYGTD